MKIKQITKHGQEQMMFHCDSCGKDAESFNLKED